ncbi:MAG: hypothetical protein ACRD2N_04720 [Vicinamibacterales bacterium]
MAKDYSHFEVCFQGFHRRRYAADVLSPSLALAAHPDLWVLSTAIRGISGANWSLSAGTVSRRRAMIADLTFSTRQSVDLHVYPFIPVSTADTARLAG